MMTDARSVRWSLSETDGGGNGASAAASSSSAGSHTYPGRDASPTAPGNVAARSLPTAAASLQRPEHPPCSTIGYATLDLRKKKLGKSKPMLPLSRERRSSGDLSSAASTGGLKLMSPADERMIDEAIELANQFARTSLQSQEPPDGDHGGGACTKSRSKFLLKFPLRKPSPQVEKKSFADGLADKTTAAIAQLLSPESEEAYYELVAKGSSPLPSQSPAVVAGSLSGTSAAAAGGGASGSEARLLFARSKSLMGSDHPMRQWPAMQHHSAPKPTTVRRSQSSATPAAADDRLRPSSAAGQSWAAARRPLHLAVVCDRGGGALGAAAAADDEGILTDDLSDLPSSPPPPVPLAPSSSAYAGIGLYNNLDPFWRHEMRLDFEADEEITNMQGRYKTRSEDHVSYEELLEFAPGVTEHDRDVIRVMQKVLGREVTESECHRALRETHGDVLNAIKFVKLVQLWRQLQATVDGFAGASVAQCKEALMYCDWDVARAARHVAVSFAPGRASFASTAARRHGDWFGSGTGAAAALPGAREPPPKRAAHRTLSCQPLAWSGT